MKRIWQADWSCNKKDIFILPLLVVAMGVLGILGVMIILRFEDAEDYVLLGTLMALFMGFLVMPALSGLKYSSWWRLSGTMGVTRKAFFSYMLLRQLGIVTLSYGVLLLLLHGEMRLYGHLYPTLPNLTDLTVLSQFSAAAAIIGANVVLQLLIGSLVVQFGTAAAGFSQIILTGTFWFITISDETRARVLAVQNQIWLILAIAALTASVVTIFLITRKMAVKS